MKYITYCKICDSVTGHEIRGFHSSCMKCGTDKKTPLIRWVAGVALILFVTAVMLWFMISSVIVLLHTL